MLLLGDKSALLIQSPRHIDHAHHQSGSDHSVQLPIGFLVFLFELLVVELLFVLKEREVGASDPIPEDGEGAVATCVVRVMKVVALSSSLQTTGVMRTRREREREW
jgi:hypothetical protein